MLVVEDILLLATATGRRSLGYPDLFVAGGLLTDLALAGNVRITEPGESVRKNRIVAVSDAPWPTDELLADAMGIVQAKPEWRGYTLLEKLAKKLPDRIYARLAQAELVSGEERKLLGLFPTTTWTVLDTRRVEELQATLDEVLLFGKPADLQAATLIALLHAGRLLQHVVDRDRKVDRKALKTQGKALMKQH